MQCGLPLVLGMQLSLCDWLSKSQEEHTEPNFQASYCSDALKNIQRNVEIIVGVIENPILVCTDPDGSMYGLTHGDIIVICAIAWKQQRY